MKEIQLTQGMIAFVDDEDYETVSAYKWRAVKNRKGRSFYAIRHVNEGCKKTTTSMHQMLAGSAHALADHINGNGLDNRRSNLRLATRAGNQHNKPMNRNNTSGYKGVCFDKPHKKWKAKIKFEGKEKALGYFHDPAEAAKAYDAAARKLHGEFACLNFPLPGEQSAHRKQSEFA